MAKFTVDITICQVGLNRPLVLQHLEAATAFFAKFKIEIEKGQAFVRDFDLKERTFFAPFDWKLHFGPLASASQKACDLFIVHEME